MFIMHTYIFILCMYVIVYAYEHTHKHTQMHIYLHVCRPMYVCKYVYMY